MLAMELQRSRFRSTRESFEWVLWRGDWSPSTLLGEETSFDTSWHFLSSSSPSWSCLWSCYSFFSYRWVPGGLLVIEFFFLINIIFVVGIIHFFFIHCPFFWTFALPFFPSFVSALFVCVWSLFLFLLFFEFLFTRCILMISLFSEGHFPNLIDPF